MVVVGGVAGMDGVMVLVVDGVAKMSGMTWVNIVPRVNDLVMTGGVTQIMT